MCGNVTLLGKLPADDRRAFPAASGSVLRRMLGVSQIRGAQSGGAAIQVARGARPRQRIEKVLNSKRGDLAERMSRRFALAARGQSAFGGVFVVQAHVRYATAGLSSEHEAHPFRYMEAQARGPRRVLRLRGAAPFVEERVIETALTHNGDMDGMRWRGAHIPFTELGCFLERVLGVENRWVGDSPVLSAAIELFLTRGLWLESLRLAFQLTVAPAPPDVTGVPAELERDERVARLRALFAKHPAPSLATLRSWEARAERAFFETWQRCLHELDGTDPLASPHLREKLAQAVGEAFDSEATPELPPERVRGFARAAVNAFLDNDLYIALRKLEPALDGTFGCVVTSTLEPGCLVALSRGQPLALGFQRSEAMACVVSERAAIKVRHDDGRAAFDQRLDLDLCRGEIARVAVDPERNTIELTLYGVADGREYHSDEMVRTGRLVPLHDNPSVAPLPAEVPDRIVDDLAALPRLLDQIRADFAEPSSLNRQTAEAFARALFSRPKPRLVVFGITNDLWLGEQFVRSLKTAFPDLDAEAKSSNEILLDPTRQAVDQRTVLLAISQSGQDFPTLGALVVLQQRAARAGVAPDAFFVLTGEVDSLMGQAVGQSYARGAAFSARIFSNLSGFRPSEAALATVGATHHTLTELLLFLAARGLDRTVFLEPPLRMALGAPELTALVERRDQTVDRSAGAIAAGLEGEGSPRVPLERNARRWVWHVIEGALAFASLVVVLELNLQLGLGVLPSTLVGHLRAALGTPPAWLLTLLGVAGAQADIAFYALFPALTVWILRRTQGRPAFHRQGTRELLIGDIPYVHRIAWLLSRKLFSLSYGFATIKSYSADCQDELIMTHEPVRGTLVIVGLPDGRREHLRARAAAAFMTAKQFSSSRSLGGAGAEIVMLSHTPPPSSGFGTHIALPATPVVALNAAGDLLMEDRFDSWERLLGIQVFLEHLARGVASLGPFRYDRSRTKDQVFAPTTAAPVSAAAIYQLLSRTSERYERFDDVALPFEVRRSEWRGSAPKVRTTVWRTSSPPPEDSGPKPEP